jgi:NAD(P)H-quinone oxidoreductase subunit 4
MTAIAHFPWLTLLILLPLVAACLIPLIPSKSSYWCRWYALGVGCLELALMGYLFLTQYDRTNPDFQFVETFAWIPTLGLNWTVSVDGLSAPLVLLAGVVTTLSMAAAWRVNRRPKLFYALMLVLYAAQIGVFVAQDLLLFFIMWEVELIPVYLLVCIWGGQNRRYAAIKFLIYTAAASIFILVAALAMAFYGDWVTFDMAQLHLKSFPLSWNSCSTWTVGCLWGQARDFPLPHLAARCPWRSLVACVDGFGRCAAKNGRLRIDSHQP